MPKKSESNLDDIRHSLAHLLAASVLEYFPGTKLGIGPVIENGFYYDFEFKTPPSPEILKKLEKQMRAYVKANLPFSGKLITAPTALKKFSDQPFKLDLIKELKAHKEKLSVYKTGEIFEDLCRGGHVDTTSEINAEAFTLTHMAGAYWKGDENNPMLTRIYGAAFHTKEELDAYLLRLEEAKKRDHKKLGVELDLFTFSPLVGPGLPLFTPRGTLLRDKLDSFVWELRKKHGYERVDIPHITKRELYETSGHWEKFSDDLFRINTRDGHEFALKPMNCPHHTQIYNRKKWSYRDLPQRYASTTKVYRDEQSGELAGLARVRSITQDDAHVFCRKENLEDEISKIWNIIETFYGAFHFPLEVHLSFHDPKEFSKYLGTPTIWKHAESAMKKVAKHHMGNDFKDVQIDIGEAAFYGPKIDFIAKDAIGRAWQVATIQLDMNMPERFDLTCINEKGKDERIFMIHAAIMGAIERFMAMLIEHTAGDFPLWLSPTQVRILAVSDAFQSYGEAVLKELHAAGIRAELSEANETLGKRIRQGEVDKIPYLLILGEKEMKSETVTVRIRETKEQNESSLSDFISALIQKIADRL